MNSSGFTSSQFDFRQSQVSQMSRYDFQIKTNHFETDQTIIDNTLIDACDSEKSYSETSQAIQNKLFLKDLETSKQNSEKTKVSGKQNNIPNSQPQSESYTQSRKIIIHKNGSSVSPYRNFNQNVDQSFKTNKIVQLQEQLIQLRKEMTLKENSWIKEKTMLLNKIQIANFDVAQMKQRNNNLIQINQTLTQALGQTSKNDMSYEYEKRVEDLNKEIHQKTKRIQFLEQNLSKLEKDKLDLGMKFKEEKEKTEYLTKNLQDYKTIVKQSNQRKFQSDQRIVLLNKNVQILKKKLTQLPIKTEYLNPVFAFINTLKQTQTTFDNRPSNPNNNSYYYSQQKPHLEISEIKKTHHQGKFFKAEKPQYREQEEYLRPNSDSKSRFMQQDSSYFNNNEESSLFSRESDFMNGQNYQNTSYFNKEKGNGNNNNHTQKNKNMTNRRNNNMGFNQRQVKRIDTEENNQQDYQQQQDNDYYQNQQQYPDEQQYSQEQQVYLCEICQRVYPHQEFIGHMKDCKEFEVLLKQKKQIESKLLLIKEQEYENRKSNMSSLNSSAIIMNKSKSKTKIHKPHENNSTKNTQRANHDRNSIERGDHTTRTNHGNKTERYQQNQQNQNNDQPNNRQYREESRESSRLQLSELMNISGISNRPSNMPGHKNKAKHHGLINPTNYFTAQMDSMNNQQNSTFRINHDQTNNYKSKPYPQIKYQTNIPNNNFSNLNNNFGKQSMEEEIRKIVEGLNEGKKKKSKPDSYPTKKGSQNNPTGNNNGNSRRDFTKANRNKADFY